MAKDKKERPAPMTYTEFQAWRERHGYTQEALAVELNSTACTIRNYEANRRRIPGVVQRCLQLLVTVKNLRAKAA